MDMRLNRPDSSVMDIAIDLTPRRAAPDEIPALARLWHESWKDAHAAIVPAALARIRTLDSFAERLASALDDVRVIGTPGEPVGLCMIKGDELYQLFVSARGRGTGVAAALIADAEARIAASGATTAWLACSIGNDRAARFYEKSGWRRAGVVTIPLETSAGPFDLDVWRYEKPVTA
jgi:GNAT superfamily N-acetyltransferase